MAAAARALAPGVQERVEAGELRSVPPFYIRPAEERPQFSQVISSQVAGVPTLDISGLQSGAAGAEERLQVLQKLAKACEEWGFFQVVNHGVPHGVVAEMRAACWRFFRQAPHDRNKLRSPNHFDPIVYNTSFMYNDWRDVLQVRDIPGCPSNGFDLAPLICREAFQEYKRQTTVLANVLYQAIFESLGLSSDYVKEAVPGIPRIIMAVNYYPECPDPNLTLGASAHSDITSLTLLLPADDDEVRGLHIRKGDQWIQVEPLVDNSFEIILGDQIQMLSNGKYKSIEHRAVTNSSQPRISIGIFFAPHEDAKIAPLSKLVSQGEPPLYKEIAFKDYMSSFFDKQKHSPKS